MWVVTILMTQIKNKKKKSIFLPRGNRKVYYGGFEGLGTGCQGEPWYEHWDVRLGTHI